MMPTKFSNYPCPPDHHRGIAAIQNPPEARRSSTSGRISGDLTGTLAEVSLSLTFISNRQISIRWSIIDHLPERVSSDLHRSDRIKSNGSESQSDRTGIG
jgi:hypothetical protein